MCMPLLKDTFFGDRTITSRRAARAHPPVQQRPVLPSVSFLVLSIFPTWPHTLSFLHMADPFSAFAASLDEALACPAHSNVTSVIRSVTELSSYADACTPGQIPPPGLGR
jgi:hypothetical protein